MQSKKQKTNYSEDIRQFIIGTFVVTVEKSFAIAAYDRGGLRNKSFYELQLVT